LCPPIPVYHERTLPPPPLCKPCRFLFSNYARSPYLIYIICTTKITISEPQQNNRSCIIGLELTAVSFGVYFCTRLLATICSCIDHDLGQRQCWLYHPSMYIVLCQFWELMLVIKTARRTWFLWCGVGLSRIYKLTVGPN